MKKNFFKKLSFVMALAMIVTALAPAAGVFAAAAPKLNAKKVYIHVAEKTQEFDFNISNKKSGWKYAWTSSNEDVAEVASNGLVTAVGKGTATIKVVIKNKNGDKVDTLKATVVVRDNIKKLTIKNPVEKLAVGKEHDYNRSFVTASGNKKVTSGITRWEVDKTGATIVANSGLFKATEAGTYKITARAFQSTAKYESWLANPTKYASYVTATVSTEVKVAADTVKAAQTTLSKVDLSFDSAMTDDVKSKISLYRLSGTTEILTAVKGITLDSTKKIATIETYSPFTEEATYVIKTTDMKDQSFVAVTSNVADVDSIDILTTAVEVNQARALDIAIYNKDKVNIADTELKGRVTFESSNSSAYLNKSVYPNTLMLFNVGDTTTITATFHTYDYDTTTGTEKGAKTDTQVVNCVKELATSNGNITAYTIANVGSPDWNNISKTLASGDTKQLFVKAKVDVDNDNEVDDDVVSTTTVYGGVSHTWKFTSSNTDVLNIDATNGTLYTGNTGSALVIVKFDDKEIGTVPITVSPRREVTSLSVDATNFDLSTDHSVADSKTVTITVKDQLGEKLSVGAYRVEVEKSSTVAGQDVFDSRTVTENSTDNVATITYNATQSGTTNAAVGTHAYRIKAIDDVSGKTVYGFVQVNVKSPTAGESTPSYWKIETNKSVYNTKITSSTDWEDVDVAVFGYASNGVKLTREDLSVAGNGIDIATPKKGTLTLTHSSTDTRGNSIANGLSRFELVGNDGSYYTKEDKGTYVLTAKVGGSVKATANFTVEDTQPTPVLTVVTLSTSVAASAGSTNADNAVKACFDVTINGSDVESTIMNVVHTGYDKSWFIKEFQVYEQITGGYKVKHTVTVNKNILTAQ